MLKRAKTVRRILTGAVATVAAATMVACAPALPGDPPGPAPTARRGHLVIRHLFTGELVAERAVEIAAPDVGVRPLEIRWMIENGTPVAPGDRLFEFDNAPLAGRLEEHRAAVEDARLSIASSESATGSKLADAELERERRRAELDKARIDADVPPGLRSEEERERRRTALEMAERRLVDAERLLEAARMSARAEVEVERLRYGKNDAELRRVEGGIARLAVTAPNPGVALVVRNRQSDRPWQVGDVVYPGQRLAVLPDLATMVVRARLYDVDDGLLGPGLGATVRLDARPELELRGRIRSVDRVAFETGRDSTTRVFWVLVDLDALDLDVMRPGMTAQVMVERRVPEDADAVLAPRASLDLSDPAVPRARLADGSWVSIALGPCDARECVVEAGLAVGSPLAPTRGAAGEPHSRQIATDWVELRPRELDVEAPLVGVVRSSRAVEYGPPTLPLLWEFRLTYVAREGSEVAIGDAVLRFDPSPLEETLRLNVAGRDAAQRELDERRKDFDAQVLEQQQALEEAQAQERRARAAAALPPDLVARATLEKSAVDLRLAQEEVTHRTERLDYLGRRRTSELAALRERRDRAAAAVVQIERGIELLTVRAKNAGVVLHRTDRDGRRKQVGDVSWRGDRILEVPEPGALRVDAWVPEIHSGALTVGQAAAVRLDADPGAAPLRARVVGVQHAVERRADLDEGAVVRVELALEETDASRVRPGMRVQGVIQIEDRPPGLAVPVGAVVSGPTGPYVMRRGLMGAASRPVELGRRHGDWVEVVAGLEVGDRVAAAR